VAKTAIKGHSRVFMYHFLLEFGMAVCLVVFEIWRNNKIEMLVLNFRIFHIYPYLTIMVEADSVGISSEPLIL